MQRLGTDAERATDSPGDTDEAMMLGSGWPARRVALRREAQAQKGG